MIILAHIDSTLHMHPELIAALVGLAVGALTWAHTSKKFATSLKSRRD